MIIKFIKSRYRAIGYTIEGIWRLIGKEESIQVQLVLFVVACAMGFVFDISSTEWMIQLLVFALIFCVEGLNTAIEEICNFINPDYHLKIKEIKDIGAGAVLFSAIFGFVVLCIIYWPKIFC